MKNIILAHENKFNCEVAEISALYFPNSERLQQQIKKLEHDYDKYIHLKNQTYKLVKKSIIGQR